jgi:hypothetical protein
MSKIITEQIKKTEILISGLKNNKDVVKKWGVEESAILALEAEEKLLDSYNQKLESLLAEARATSKEANKKLYNVKAMFATIKKQIKTNNDPLKWSQFGVMDKR